MMTRTRTLLLCTMVALIPLSLHAAYKGKKGGTAMTPAVASQLDRQARELIGQGKISEARDIIKRLEAGGRTGSVNKLNKLIVEKQGAGAMAAAPSGADSVSQVEMWKQQFEQCEQVYDEQQKECGEHKVAVAKLTAENEELKKQLAAFEAARSQRSEQEQKLTDELMKQLKDYGDKAKAVSELPTAISKEEYEDLRVSMQMQYEELNKHFKDLEKISSDAEKALKKSNAELLQLKTDLAAAIKQSEQDKAAIAQVAQQNDNYKLVNDKLVKETARQTDLAQEKLVEFENTSKNLNARIAELETELKNAKEAAAEKPSAAAQKKLDELEKAKAGLVAIKNIVVKVNDNLTNNPATCQQAIKQIGEQVGFMQTYIDAITQ